MKPHKHADLIKAWADGAQIQYHVGKNWVDIPDPGWAETVEYRIKPAETIVRNIIIQNGITTVADGTIIDLQWIQGLLLEAYTAHGHSDFAFAANKMAKVTGMPHSSITYETKE